MTKSPSLTAILAAAALVVLVAAPMATAVICEAKELSPCLPAFMGPPTPTSDCCNKLKEQQPCMCGYMKDPGLKKYWDNPKAKTIADACRIPFPPQC